MSAITAKTVGTLALLLCVPASAKDAERWVWVTNLRFGTIAEIPQGIFESTPPPANGDGRGFLAGDGAKISIYGSLNHEQSSTAHRASMLSSLASEGIKITYEAGGASWLAYSRLKANNVVYYKQIEGCGAIHTV